MKTYIRGKDQRMPWREIMSDSYSPLPSGGAVIRINLEGRIPVEVRINNERVKYNADQMELFLEETDNYGQQFVMRVFFDDGSSQRVEFFRPESILDPQLLNAIADFESDLQALMKEGEVTAFELYEAITDGRLRLLSPRDPVASVGQWLLEPIEAALPFLLSVCSRPRQHLCVEEDIRPIGVVRRTGPAALRHIASHSEHWEARTIGGLRPARLLAQVVEDDLHLYENRFVKTLIDRLYEHISRVGREVEEAKGQNENVLDYDNFGKEFNYSYRYDLLRMLVQSSDLIDIERNYKKFEQMTQVVSRIQHQLAGCKASRFYQALRKAPPVKSPVLPTNILTMDPNYRPLFDLWLLLDEVEQHRDHGQDEISFDDFARPYVLYCQVLLLASMLLWDTDAQLNDEMVVLQATDDDGLVNISGSFAKGDWTVQPSIEWHQDQQSRLTLSIRRQREQQFEYPRNVVQPDAVPNHLREVVVCTNKAIIFYSLPNDQQWREIIGLHHVDSVFRDRDFSPQVREERRREWNVRKRNANYWSEFINAIRLKVEEPSHFTVDLIPILASVGNTAEEIAYISAGILDEMEMHRTASDMRSAVALLPFAPRLLPSITPAHLIRRLVNIGDCYTPGIDAERWGDRRAGMLPVSCWQPNSLQRLLRMINVYTVGIDIAQNHKLQRCPICGSESVRCNRERNGRESFECYSCGGQWSVTTCPNKECDGYHFAWLSPKNSRRIEHNNTNYGAAIERIENIGGGIAIVGFCESDLADPGRVPICPKCGRCSRCAEYALECRRCKGMSEMNGKLHQREGEATRA